jgi:hypothetical protein
VLQSANDVRTFVGVDQRRLLEAGGGAAGPVSPKRLIAGFLAFLHTSYGNARKISRGDPGNPEMSRGQHP